MSSNHWLCGHWKAHPSITPLWACRKWWKDVVPRPSRLRSSKKWNNIERWIETSLRLSDRIPPNISNLTFVFVLHSAWQTECQRVSRISISRLPSLARDCWRWVCSQFLVVYYPPYSILYPYWLSIKYYQIPWVPIESRWIYPCLPMISADVD